MLLFSKKNLRFQDYKWTEYPKGDTRISGKPDTTPFERNEGNQVVYLINKLMTNWSYRFVNTGNKMEKLIHDDMPGEIKTQQDVQEWLAAHLKF